MAATDRGAGVVADASLVRLLSGLVDDLGRLLRQEVRLARAEMAEKLQRAAVGLYALIAGLLASFCALFVLLQAAVYALSRVMPAWAAGLCVGLVTAVVAFLLIRYALASLNARTLLPERTLRAGRVVREAPAQARQSE